MRRFLFLLVLMSFTACQQEASQKMQTYSGFALGTDYQLKFFADEKLDLQTEIDSIFEVVNKSMSTYQDDSAISKINEGDSSIIVDEMFKTVFLKSKEIHENTFGYFDPTVGDLVNLYGLGPKKMKIEVDSTAIDSLMNYVGLDKVSITEENKIIKEYPETVLDFNGIAKGYAVDLLGFLLEEKEVENYLAEIGGEIRSKGKNLSSGKYWRLGIDDPRIETNPNELQGVVELRNKSLATSGNYRKFKHDSITGEKYNHIIDPTSGYTKKVNMLSVSVLADDCATADAYATAFMAMGIEKSKQVAEKQKDIDVFFIYDKKGELETYLSKGFEEMLVK